jgi:hypothetical protein
MARGAWDSSQPKRTIGLFDLGHELLGIDRQVPRYLPPLVQCRFAQCTAAGQHHGGRRGHPWGPEHARKREEHLKFWKCELSLQTQMDLIDIQSRVERMIHRAHIEIERSGKTHPARMIQDDLERAGIKT